MKVKMSKRVAKSIVCAGIVGQYSGYTNAYGDEAWTELISYLVRREARRVLKGGKK